MYYGSNGYLRLFSSCSRLLQALAIALHQRTSETWSPLQERMAGTEESRMNPGEDGVSCTIVSQDRERQRRKRRKVRLSDPSRWEPLHSGCLQLLQELEDLEKAVEEDYLRRNWFSRVRILLNRPIHFV